MKRKGASIHYLTISPAPDGSGEIGFFEPNVARLSKARQVGKKRKPKNPFPCNRDKAWRKPLNGNAVRRNKQR